MEKEKINLNAYVKMTQAEGYRLGCKETANKLIGKMREMLNSCETVYEDDEYLITPNVGYLMKDVDAGLDEIEKEFVDEMKE